MNCRVVKEVGSSWGGRLRVEVGAMGCEGKLVEREWRLGLGGRVG